MGVLSSKLFAKSIYSLALAFFVAYSGAYAAPGDINRLANVGLNAAGSIASNADASIFYFGDVEGEFHAISSIGAKLHQITLNGSVKSTPIVAPNGDIYVGTYAGTVYALNPDLTEKWSFTVNGSVQASLALAANGYLIVGDSSGTVRALDSSGASQWTTSTNGIIGASLAVNDANQIVLANASGEVLALNQDTGVVELSFKLPAKPDGSHAEVSSFAIQDDGKIYFGAYDRRFYALNSNFLKDWDVAVGGRVANSPVIDSAGDVYYIDYDYRKIVALDTKPRTGIGSTIQRLDGQKKWTYQLNAKAYSAPLVSSTGILYVTDLEGYVYAFNTENGALNWVIKLSDAVSTSPMLDSSGYLRLVTASGDFVSIETDGAGLDGQWPMLGKNGQRIAWGGVDSDADTIPDYYDDNDDNDPFSDAWEVANGYDPLVFDAANNDEDEDGLTDLEEYQLGTNPRSGDTDGDGLSDNWEFVCSDRTGTVCNNYEVRCLDEARTQCFDPFVDETTRGNTDFLAAADPDQDGLTNGEESFNGTSPFLADTDGDGLSDLYEVGFGEPAPEGYEYPPCDADGDGNYDRWRSPYGLNPLVDDANLDVDCDRYSNTEERDLGTNPVENEFDNRGITDVEAQKVQFLSQANFNWDSDAQILIHPSNQFVFVVSGFGRLFTFERNSDTGELAYLSDIAYQTTAPAILSPDGKFLYSFVATNVSHDRIVVHEFSELTKEITQLRTDLGNIYIKTIQKRSGNVAFDSSSESMNYAFQGTYYPNISPAGDYLFLPTGGRSGVVVYERLKDTEGEFTGELNFHTHIVDQFSFNPTVTFSSSGRYVIVASTLAGNTGLLLEAFDLDALSPVPVTMSTPAVGVYSQELPIISGLEPHQIVYPRAVGGLSGSFLFSIEFNEQTLSFEQTTTDIVDYERGVSFESNKLVGLLQAGFDSFAWRKIPGTVDPIEYGYRAVSKTVIPLPGTSDAFTPKSGQTRLSADGRFLYALFPYASTETGEQGIYVLNSDYAGIDRPDFDSDGVENALDDFPGDAANSPDLAWHRAFSEDQDGDGVPDRFNDNCDIACQDSSGYVSITTDEDGNTVRTYLIDVDKDGDGYLDVDSDGDDLDISDKFPNNNCAWQDTDLDGLPDELIPRNEINGTVDCDSADNALVVDSDDDNDGYRDYIYNEFPSFGNIDAFRQNPEEWFNTDIDSLSAPDSLGNNEDQDDDGDGIPDSWEIAYALDPYDDEDAADDFDSDGLINLEEFARNSHPYIADTDGDGVIDSNDDLALFAQASRDSDGDGQPDEFHSDCDQICRDQSNLVEDLDDDNDGLADTWENICTAVSESGVCVAFEPRCLDDQQTLCFDSTVNNNLDTGLDDLRSGADPDNDGLDNLAESSLGTNPFSADSDNDGIDDLFETSFGQPLPIGSVHPECDANGDGAPDRWNYPHGLNPLEPDANLDFDCDYYSNLEEYALNTNPLINEFDDQVIGEITEENLQFLGSSEYIWETDATVLVDPKDRFVFVTNPVRNDGKIYTFARSEDSPQLVQVAVSDFMDEYDHLMITPDGNNIYVFENKLIRTYRISESGAVGLASGIGFSITVHTLTFGEYTETTPAAELLFGNELGAYPVISRDGSLMFVPSTGDSGILVYDRISDGNGGFTGALAFKKQLLDTNRDAAQLMVTPDNKYLLVQSWESDDSAFLQAYDIETLEPIEGSKTSYTYFNASNIALSGYRYSQGFYDDKANEWILPYYLKGLFGSSIYYLQRYKFDDSATPQFTRLSTQQVDFLTSPVENEPRGLLQSGLRSYALREDDQGKYIYQRFNESILSRATFGTYRPKADQVRFSNDGNYLYILGPGLVDGSEESGIYVVSADYAGIGGIDSDNDGVDDRVDEFDNDPNESVDTDSDGIGNNADLDDDGDGFYDTWEAQYTRVSDNDCDAANPRFSPLKADIQGVDNYRGDVDCDGLSDLEEQRLNTNPWSSDTDLDGIPDIWEVTLGLDPLYDDAGEDPDGDLYTNLREYQLGTHLFHNTFADSDVSQKFSYQEGDDTNGLGDLMPSLVGAQKLIAHPNGSYIYLEYNGALTQFEIDSNESNEGALVYKDAISTDEGQTSYRSGISPDGNHYYVFRNTTGLGNIRDVYNIDSETGTVTLDLGLRGQIVEKDLGLSADEAGEPYGTNTDIAFSADGTFVYVPSTSLGVAIYSRNLSTGELTFVSYYRPYEAVEFDASQGILISSEPESAKAYVIELDKIHVLDRDFGTGVLSSSSILSNISAENYLELRNALLGGQIVARTAIDTEVFVNDSLNASIPSAEGIEVNPYINGMLYLLREGELDALSSDGAAFLQYMNLALQANGQNLIPVDTVVEPSGKYLYLLSQSAQDASMHLVVLNAGIKGIGYLDSDGDGVNDLDDHLPLDPTETIDLDKDGCGANKDFDDLDPTKCEDTDGDGIADSEDLDDDGDCLNDSWEARYCEKDASGNCIAGNRFDPKLSETSSVLLDCSLYIGDIDGDGLSDYLEQVQDSNPLIADTDGDGVNDAEEYGLGTDPNADTKKPVLTIFCGASTECPEYVQPLERNLPFVLPRVTATDEIDNDTLLTRNIVVSGEIDVEVIGEQSITWTVEDEAGNKADPITITVTVVDTVAPEVALRGRNPHLIEQPREFNADTWVYADPKIQIINDNKDDEIVVFGNPENIDVTAVGSSYNLSYVATDTSGNNSETLYRTVQVLAPDIPVVSLNGPVNPHVWDLGVDYLEPGFSATDNVDGTYSNRIRRKWFKKTATNTSCNNTDTLLDSKFETDVLGEFILCYQTTDRAGYTSEYAERLVVIRDADQPVITLVGRNPVSVELANPSYREEGATAVDDTQGNITSEIQVAYAPAAFNSNSNTYTWSGVGQYELTYSVEDEGGNSAAPVIRVINVEQNEAPVMSLNGRSPQPWEQGVPYTDPGVTIIDNVDTNLSYRVEGLSDLRVNTPGSYTLTYFAEDNAGNQAAPIERIVEVGDQLPPEIRVNGDNPTYLVVGSGAYQDQGASVSDIGVGVDLARPGANPFGIIVEGVESVNTNEPGTHQITYRAFDLNGNEASNIRVVNVRFENQIPPEIEFNDVRIYEDNEQLFIDHEQGTEFTDIVYTATDDLDGDLTSEVITGLSATNCNDEPAYVLDINVDFCSNYLYSFDVSDYSGNQSDTENVLVRVRDRTKPVLALIGYPAMAIELDTPFVDPGATARDAIDGNLDDQIQRSGEVDETTEDTYTLSYSVSDRAGNQSVIQRQVVVTGRQNPEITLIGGNVISVEKGTNFEDPGAVAVDVKDGNISAWLNRTGSVNTDVIDSYILTYTVVDTDGLAADPVQRTVNVVDTIPPSISLLGPPSVELEFSQVFDDPGVNASDVGDGDLNGAVVIGGTYVDSNQEGQFIRTYTVFDGSNNEATVQRTIIVRPNTPPVAFDDTLDIDEDTPITVNVVANDTDANNHSLIASAVGQAANGTVELSQGLVNYTPNEHFHGSDSFTYTVSDQFGGEDTGTVNITIHPLNDLPTGQLNISGLFSEYETLTLSPDFDDADGLGEISYQWKRDNLDVVGQNSVTYILSKEDIGTLISVEASYVDGDGTAETVTSSSTPAINNTNDDPTGSVVITGTVEQGQTLTATNTLDDADGLGQITYQWYRGGVEQEGQTTETYLLSNDDVGAQISVQANYTDGFGTAESVSSAPTIAVVNVNDLPIGSVTISGLAQEDETLTASNTLTDADGLGDITYQWLRDGVDIADATGSSYVLGDDDVAKQISVTASYVDGYGQAESVPSSPTVAIANVNDLPQGNVTISGTPSENETLSANHTLTDADGIDTAITYQWLRDGAEITGETGTSYTLVDADVGTRISVKASYVDSYGQNESVNSGETGTIANVNDLPGGNVTISGLTQEDETLTVSNSLTDADGINSEFVYQWLRDGAAVSGATGTNYVLGDADVATQISVSVSYTDNYGESESVTSEPTSVIANVNDLPEGSVTISGNAEEDQTLTASHSLSDADGMGSVTFQWKRNGADIPNANTPTYVLGDADVATQISVSANYVDQQGTAESVSSVSSTPVVNINDLPAGNVTISGLAQEDETLTVENNVSDADGIASEFTFQWNRAGSAVPGATGTTYVLGDDDVATQFTVTVSYTDTYGESESVTSTPTAAIANVDDEPTGNVVISGLAQEDETLTATNDIVDLDGFADSIVYQWQRNGVDITGATSDTYTLGDSDVSTEISVSASYTDGYGTSESVTSASTSAILNVNDLPEGSVNISGVAREDETLTASNSLTDADTIVSGITYQWKRAGSDINGATGANYVLGDADVGSQISVTASYTDGHGKVESVTSAQTAAIENVNDLPSGSVTISGLAREGETLNASNTITDADTISGNISYQWRRDGAVIAGATDTSYTLDDSDVASRISVTANYVDGYGKAESLTSLETDSVDNVNDLPVGTVLINGISREDETLTAVNSFTDADGINSAIGYQWKRNGSDIPGASDVTYVLVDGDVGAQMSVVATYVDSYGQTETVTSELTIAVENVNDNPTGAVTISGTATEGQTLTVSHNLVDLDGLGSLSYQWKRNGSNISGATNSSYVLNNADVGAQISVVASYVDNFGTAESVESSATAAVTSTNDAPVGSVTISGIVREDETLSASHNLTDADGLGSITFQWKRNGVNIPGATDLSYILGDDDVATQISVSANYIDGQGTAESVSSAPTISVENVNDLPTGSVSITGTAKEGETLVASSLIDDADGIATAITYQWKRDGINVVGATGPAYTLTSLDVATRISVSANYVDTHGSNEELVSSETDAVANLNSAPEGEVTISGIVQEDQVLTAANTLTDADSIATGISYQWSRDGANISGATGSSYLLSDVDVGYQISVTASYVDGEGKAESVSSVPTIIVANVNDDPTGSVSITGLASEGETLTAVSTIDDQDGMGEITFEWRRDGVVINGVVGSSYILSNDDVGYSIDVVASYTDGHGFNEIVTSASTATISPINLLVEIVGEAFDGSVLTLSNNLDSYPGLNLSGYKWLVNGLEVSGEVNEAYSVRYQDIGLTIEAVVVYTDNLGAEYSVASTATLPVADRLSLETGSVTLPASFGVEFTSVTFNQEYSRPPMVFVMDTLDNTDPSKIRIRNVTRFGFELAQVEAINTTVNVPIGEITVDYLVIEEGSYLLPGGSRIEVGYVDTDRTVAHSSVNTAPTGTSWETINFSQSFTTPAVLAQIQTVNNGVGPTDIFFATAMRNATGSSFQLGLERAEVNRGVMSSQERVAYLAIENGAYSQFTDIDGVNTIDMEALVTSRDIRGYQNNDCHVSTFSFIDSSDLISVGTQMTRFGNNGGWLRRCSQTNNSVGFLIDEDTYRDTERSHITESAGVIGFSRSFTASIPQ